MPKKDDILIGQLLIEEGIITSEELQAAAVNSGDTILNSWLVYK